MSMPRLILPADFEKSGRDRRQLVTLCNSGELTRLRRGVYADTAAVQKLRPLQRYGLDVLAFQEVASRQPLLAHATAALLWGLWIVGTPRRLHVMTDVMVGGRNENGVIRHRGSMTDGLQRCGPFLLTDKLTTVMQLILALDFPYAVAICDSSLRVSERKHQFNRFNPESMESPLFDPLWQSTYPQGQALLREDLTVAAENLPSATARRRALAVIGFANPLSGSAGESISRAKMHLFGFPAPILQQRFILRDGSDALTDFWFEKIRLVGEFDGKGKYLRDDWGGGLSIADRVMKEKRRENQIRAQVNGFVRWEWNEMMNQERFISLLRAVGLRQQ